MALKLMNRKDARAHEGQGKAQQRELHRPWRIEPTIKAECLYIVYCNRIGLYLQESTSDGIGNC